MSNIVTTPGDIEKILDRDGVYPSVTVGTSMRPLFKTHRDMIVVEKAEGMLKKYDVALYRIGDKYILHRVIGIDEEKKIYIIRGDNTYKNEHIPFSKILGKLTQFKRRGKHHTVNDVSYRIYSVIWNFLYPVRWSLFKARCIAGKAYRTVFPRKKKSED